MFDQDESQVPAVTGAQPATFGQPFPPASASPDGTLTMDNSATTSPASVSPVFTAPTPAPLVTSPTRSNESISHDELLSLKQEVLQNLSPLVGKLDQPPEEKFKTTMMMIQASDDQSLIKSAYETANEITDEKARAQALLDIVNEINYFTQQHNSTD
jgi:hypothetical protein